jgi:hypothetical protein
MILANTIQGSGNDGVYVFNASGNAIGGSSTGQGNTIQNSGFSGVHIEGSSATGNVVQGNAILNQTSGYGVLLDNGATGNTIGGSGSAANSFQNNALGNVQVLANGLPIAGNPTGGNTIGGNNNIPAGQTVMPTSLHTHKLKLRHHAKVHKVKQTAGKHPHGPRKHMRKPPGAYY